MAKKIILACMAIAAFAAFVIPATASAKPALCETTADNTCSTLASGALITGTNVGDWTFTNSLGPITCQTVHLTGNLTENSGSSIKGDITSATFSGTGTNGDCTGPLGTSIQVIVNEGNGLPWCISANTTMAADEFQVRGNSCTAASRSITFRFNITGLNDCKYNKTTPVVGSFTTHTSASEDAVLTFSEQEWTLEEENKTSIFAPACPSSGKLDGKATLETDPTSSVPLYVENNP